MARNGYSTPQGSTPSSAVAARNQAEGERKQKYFARLRAGIKEQPVRFRKARPEPNQNEHIRQHKLKKPRGFDAGIVPSRSKDKSRSEFIDAVLLKRQSAQ